MCVRRERGWDDRRGQEFVRRKASSSLSIFNYFGINLFNSLYFCLSSPWPASSGASYAKDKVHSFLQGFQGRGNLARVIGFNFFYLTPRTRLLLKMRRHPGLIGLPRDDRAAFPCLPTVQARLLPCPHSQMELAGLTHVSVFSFNGCLIKGAAFLHQGQIFIPFSRRESRLCPAGDIMGASVGKVPAGSVFPDQQVPVTDPDKT